MNKTTSIEELYKRMSCHGVMDLDFKDRCEFITNVENCKQYMNFINYFGVIYCQIGVQSRTREYFVMIVLILIAIYLSMLMLHVLEKYFGPVLKVLSVKLHMSEYLAGVTLLSLCNASPDLLVNFMPIRAEAPLITITISNAIAIVLLGGGIVCFLRPFQISGHSAFRDFLFLVLSCEVLVYVVDTDQLVTKEETLYLMSLYALYYVVIIIDVNLLRVTVKMLSDEIDYMINSPKMPNRRRLLRRMERRLFRLEEDNKLLVYNRRANRFSTNFRTTADFTGRRTVIVPPALDQKATRNILYDAKNPRNLLLLEEFIHSLMPFEMDEWKTYGFLGRLYLIIISPFHLLCVIFIPLVDFGVDKHGWSKLLNCSQIITNPIIFIMGGKVLIDISKEPEDWHASFDLNYAKWSLILTVPVTLAVFLRTRTDKPPSYHELFIILTGSLSLLLVAIFAVEIEILCVTVATVFHVTEDFLAATIRSSSTALSDVLLNVDLAKQGYEKMAFAAILASPLFGITISMGGPIFFNVNAHEAGSVFWIYGWLGETCHIFFLLTIFATLGWAFTYNFVARRSAGIFSFILYALFIIYACLIEMEYFNLSEDRDILPQ